jgi:ABC-2 type transport system ATP-binding protein
MRLEDIVKGNIINSQISFDIYEKNIAIIGKNGKGKTTLLRILSGNVLPDKGSVILDEKIFSFPLEWSQVTKYQRSIRNKTLYFENQNYLYSNFTCMQNVKYCMADGSFNKELFWETLEEFEFDKRFLEKKVEELSLGTKQKISLSLAFSSKRPIILLDEPTLGLDIDSKNVFLEFVKSNKNKRKIVISSNDNSVLDGFNTFLLCEDGEVRESHVNPYSKS